jgi:hypothetical protein
MAPQTTRTVEFTRYGGDGRTVEYRTPETPSATLAYLDLYSDGTAAAVVHDPTTDRSRTYDRRPEHRARAIIARHLRGLGYFPGPVEQLDAPEAGEERHEDGTLWTEGTNAAE